MKYQKLKRQVLIETAIITGVTIVLAAIIYLISAILDDYTEGNQAMQMQVDVIDGEMKKLQARYNNIKNNLTIYDEVQKKKADGELAINRTLALDKFNQFKSQFMLNGLRLTVSPAQETKDPLLKRTISTVNFSEVSVTFDALTDENVYELIDTLRTDFPGVCKFVKLDMVLQRPFSNDVYQEISQKGTAPLVRTDVRFLWFGINVIPPPEIKPDANKK